MAIPGNRKKLSADEYLSWLNTYLMILDDFTTYAEKDLPANYMATMVSFLRIAEHSFNHFINHRATYEREICSEDLTDAVNNTASMDYGELKIERDKVAHRIATIIESDPLISERFRKFCNNLKEPRTLGCCL